MNTSPHPNNVTIVIPCYNQANFVREAIQSCISQTVAPKEVIVLLMDPASRALSAELQNISPLVRTVSSGRKLLPSARNFGFGLATTDYVIPLDADDTLPNNFIEEISKISADVVYVSGKLFGSYTGWWPPDPSEEIDWDKQTTFRRNPIVCTALIKRSVWAAAGGYSDTLTAFEDMDFWIRLHELGYEFKKCHTTYLNYRKHDTSMIKDTCGDKAKVRKLHEEIVDIHSEYYSHIPHVLHYVWMGNAPRPTAVIDTWKKHLPKDWVIKEWNETNIDINSPKFPKLLSIAYNARKYGIAVDPIRAWLMYEHGGWWIDADCVLTRDITPFCQFDFVASYESHAWLNVGLVGARKGSPIFKQVLDYYHNVKFIPSVVYGHELFVNTIGTGPHVLTRTLQKMTRWVPDNLPQTIEMGKDRVRLEHPGVFVLDDEASGAYNYALHLYSATWTTQTSSWAQVVYNMYHAWKNQQQITGWKG